VISNRRLGSVSNALSPQSVSTSVLLKFGISSPRQQMCESGRIR
jgi:hypothetical protein